MRTPIPRALCWPERTAVRQSSFFVLTEPHAERLWHRGPFQQHRKLNSCAVPRFFVSPCALGWWYGTTHHAHREYGTKVEGHAGSLGGRRCPQEHAGRQGVGAGAPARITKCGFHRTVMTRCTAIPPKQTAETHSSGPFPARPGSSQVPTPGARGPTI